MLQLQGVTNYFDVQSPSIAENKNEEQEASAAEGPPWNPPMEEYSETHSMDHQGRIIISTTMTMG